MSKHDDHFLPERVDEQIDALARTQEQDPTLASGTRLVADLHQLNMEDSELIERVRVRLATYTEQQRDNSVAHTATQGRVRQNMRTDRRKGPHIMEPHITKPTRERKRLRFLEMLAAALLVVALVGSMSFLLHSRQPSSGKAGDATPTAATTPKATSTTVTVTSQNALYVAAKDGVDRLDLTTGKVVWHVKSGRAGNLVVEKNSLMFVGSDLTTIAPDQMDHAFYVEAVNTTNGKQLWRNTYGSIYDLQGANGVVYVSVETSNSGNPSHIDALKASNGQKLWSHTSSQAMIWELYQDGVVYGIAYEDFFAINATSGHPLWQKTLQAYPNQLANMTPVVSNGAMYFSTCNTAKQASDYGTCDFFAFNAASGNLLWQIPFGDQGTSNIVSPTVVDGVLYIASMNGVIHALNTTTGATLWTYATGGNIFNPILAGQGMIYAEIQNATNTSMNVLALTVTSTSHAVAWSHNLASIPGTLDTPNMLIENGRLYLLDNNNAILVFQADTGDPGQGYHLTVQLSTSFVVVSQNAG